MSDKCKHPTGPYSNHVCDHCEPAASLQEMEALLAEAFAQADEPLRANPTDDEADAAREELRDAMAWDDSRRQER